MNAIAAVGARLAPLVGMLGSDHDLKILAAVRKIGQLLGDHGLNFNDLALAITAPPADPFAMRPDETGLRSWQSAVQWILGHPGWHPSDKEYAFVANMRSFLTRRDPSVKQGDWIRSIVERLGRRIDA